MSKVSNKKNMDKLSAELWENMKNQEIRNPNKESEVDENGNIICQSFFEFLLPISQNRLLRV